MRRTRGTQGVTLVELMTVVVLVGITAALAAPSFDRVLADVRRRSAAGMVAGDLFLTRMSAVRSGRPAVLRFGSSGRCTRAAGAKVAADEYTLVVAGPPEHVVKAVSLRGSLGRVCLQMNNSDSVAFDSRGLLVPFANRTLWLEAGGLADTISISVVGRVLRR